MGKICFIAGHGGTSYGSYDPGATYNGYEEFKIVKEIAKYAQTYYNKTYKEQSTLMNYKGNLSLSSKINYFQDNTYDFIAEIHLNAGGGDGVECYYKNGNTLGKKYADKICDNISAALGIPQRPNWTDEDGGDKVKLDSDGTDYFGIIRSTKPTAVLIECCFIDTLSNLKAIKTASGQKKCGEAIAKAVAQVRGAKKKNEFEPYQVKVIYKKVNIRKTPKFTKKDIVGTITDKGVYTIVAEKKVSGIPMGKLKSGEGWISLRSKYVKKLK